MRISDWSSDVCSSDLRVLRSAAALLRARSRSYDLVARIGGDEFVVWLDETGLADASVRAGQLVEAFAGLECDPGVSGGPLSVYVGIAEFEPAAGESLRDLLMPADRSEEHPSELQSLIRI